MAQFFSAGCLDVGSVQAQQEEFHLADGKHHSLQSLGFSWMAFHPRTHTGSACIVRSRKGSLPQVLGLEGYPQPYALDGCHLMSSREFGCINTNMYN